MKNRIVLLALGVVTLASLLSLAELRDSMLVAFRLAPGGAFAVNYAPAILAMAWLVGAFIMVVLVDLFVWDLLVARTLKSPVPGVLKALGAFVIYLVAITCIVGVVYQRNLAGFLAALGAGSFAVGFALRNLFSDIFTGLAVNLDRTFRIGDWIELSERTGVTVGQIEEIGWRSTHLRTEEQKTVVIPNSYLAINRITNVSRPSLATRYQTTLTIDFSVPVTRAKRVLLAGLHAVHDLPGFYRENKPEVLAAEANERGLAYILRYWIVSWSGISPNRARDVVMTSVMEHLSTAGITPAYEKSDVFHQVMPERNWEGHSRENQLALLSRLDLFSMLEPGEIETLADAIRRRIYRSGEVLFRQGDAGDVLYILTEGLLDVSLGENGSQQVVGRILPGEFVGEMSVLTGDPRSATVAALTASVAYEIDGQTIHKLLESRPQIAERLSEVIAERKMQNAETARLLRENEHAEEVATFAGQFLKRIRDFLSLTYAKEAGRGL